MIALFLILAISATGFGYKYPPGLPGEKPGFCGPSDVVTDCSCRPENIVCRNDYECPFNLKCCSYGCGCRTECRPPVPFPGQQTGYVCNLPQQPGPCYAYFPRWWYNRATNQCELFIYGGCEGNANNFETKEACLQRCKRKY
uniref:Eppin-like n=1 Tax=Crassostrea virginica TaxID=6565 RepID=A0A8B8CZ34_CRAVI|nr:eppin-like [Crassostrea virginica]